MTVIVDTSVWSLALRRRPARLSRLESQLVSRLRDLIESDEAALVGPVRQELLSGIAEAPQFRRLAELLNSIPCIAILEQDYDTAALCYNACRRVGVAGSAIDMLLCAVAIRVGVPLLTCDKDFERYARVLDLSLMEVD